MPQKKNPDVPELVRGKTGRVYGNLMSLLTLMKSLPLSYNRDLQEDKVALFDTVETTRSCLNIFSLMLPEIKVNKQKMAQAAQSGFLTATDLADYLAGKGIPFRTAHEIVGRIVLYCMRKKKTLPDLKLEELQKFSTAITQDALKQLTIETSINNRKSFGATGKQAVKRAFTRARAELRRRKRFINQLRN
jgi:argininosuccinate lyase